MRLSIGARANATDGDFGQVTAVVLDPTTRTVTHLVVTPDGGQRQARLLPIWLCSERAGVVEMSLDLRHAGQLQRVFESEYVLAGPATASDDGHDMRGLQLLLEPYWFTAEARYGRTERSLPVDECEIRRNCEVRLARGGSAGRVEGLLVEDDRLTAVVVRTDVRDWRRFRVVPIEAVNRITADAIHVSLDWNALRRLPGPEGLNDPTGAAARGRPFAPQLDRVFAALRDRIDRR